MTDSERAARLGQAQLTALQVARCIDALPCTCTPSEHAASRPAVPHLCARAAAEPALFGEGFGRRARARSHALAIADDVGRAADAMSWVRRGKGREAVRASEPAGISADAGGHAVIGVVAVRIRRIA